MDAQEYLLRFQRRELNILVDTPAGEPATALFACLQARGFHPQPLTETAFQATTEAPSLLLMTELQTLQRLRQWWGTCAIPVCHLAVARFDPSLASIEYALERLLHVPVAAGLARRQQVYEQLFSSRAIEIHTSAGVCRIDTRDSVEVPNHSTMLEPGCVYSITEFLEASMVNLEAETSSFSVEGILAFDGLNVLYNRSEQQSEFGESLSRLLTLSSRGKNYIRVEENRLIQLNLNGRDYATELHDLMAGRERGLHITELGIGCACYPTDLDFSINALVNKITMGAYMGIGMGWQFPHVDLISRDASIIYLP